MFSWLRSKRAGKGNPQVSTPSPVAELTPRAIVPTPKPKRVIVVGSEDHQHVLCVAWDASSFPNVADYDAAIIDVTSLTDLVHQAVKSDDEECWGRLLNNLDKLSDGVRKLLDSGGEMFVILAPAEYVNYVYNRSANLVFYNANQIYNYRWCPFPFELTKEEGETIEIKDQNFSRYFESTKRWELLIERSSDRAYQTYFKDIYDKGYVVGMRTESVAENRYGGILAAKFRYSVFESDNRREPTNPSPVQVSGHLTLLPPRLQGGIEESINIILKDCLGVEQPDIAPAWANQIVVPDASAIQIAVESKQAQIASIEAEINGLNAQAESLHTYRQLLYETGKELEDICKVALRFLGGNILPAAAGQEEFILEWNGRRAVVEIKGNTKSIKLTDLRQLGDYLERYRSTISENGKGIFIGNAWRLIPPKERAEAVFPSNVIDHASRRDIALVYSVELFNAVCEVMRGNADRQEVMKRLFDGVGITSLSR